MGTDTQDTATLTNAGENQEEVREDGTAAGTEAGGEQLTDEQKQAQAAKEEEERKAEEAKKGGVSKIGRTIRDLKRDRREAFERAHQAELKAARLEGENEALKRLGVKGGSTEEEEPAPVRPKMEDFETVAEFNTANTEYLEKRQDWLIKQDQKARAKEREEWAKTHPAPQPPETPQQKAHKERREQFQKTIAKASEDVRDVINKDTKFPMSADMMDALNEKTETGARIAEYLVENPDIAGRLYSMPPVQVVREIDKLEQLITKKKTTNASPPVSTVEGKAGAPPKSITDAKTSEERYAIWERERKEGVG